jgi:hypothetical protein
MYICPDCGQIVDELPRGVDWVPAPFGNGSVPMETSDWDCSCGGEYQCAAQCTKCGEYILGDDVINGLCPECFNDKYDLDYALADDDTAAIEINSFLASQFDTDEIETILCEKLRELPKAEMDAAAEKYYREVV